MRLWSLHPRYLDRMGLLGVWREAIVAKRLLLGEPVGARAKQYINHAQLNRFKLGGIPPFTSRIRIGLYLFYIYHEGIKRGYKFNPKHKDVGLLRFQDYIGSQPCRVTIGQLEFELQLLKQRTYTRNGEWFDTRLRDLVETIPEPNPVFSIVWGPREKWDRGKLKIEWNWTQYCQLPASQTNHVALQKGEF